MSDNDNGDDGGINITLGKLIAYPIGILLLLSGLFNLLVSVAGGMVILLSGIIALPIARSKIKEETGVGINRWAASAIVIVLALVGGGIVAGSSGGLDTDNAGGGGGDNVQLIDQPATELLPTIDDFESGWRGEVNDDGTADFVNVESDEVVQYNVTVFDSVDAASNALDDRSPDNTATSEVNIGDGGWKYALSEEAYIVQFRQQNVVCKTTYQGSIATFDAEGNAEDLARTCADSINQ